MVSTLRVALRLHSYRALSISSPLAARFFSVASSDPSPSQDSVLKLPSPALPLFRRALDHSTNVAIVNEDGSKQTYARLLSDAMCLAGRLVEHLSGRDLGGSRISFLSPPTYDYVVIQWAIWLAGGVAVPLSPHHTLQELSYFTSVRQSLRTHSHTHTHIYTYIPPAMKNRHGQCCRPRYHQT